MKRSVHDSDKEDESTRSRRDADRPNGRSKSDAGSVAALHRAVGNRAVQQLHEDGRQTGVSVSQPGDASEREAERVAEQVVGLEQPGSVATHSVDVQPVVADGSMETDGVRAEQLRGVQNGGRPLPAGTRSFFEARFDRDFGNVRIHTGSHADTMGRRLNARAFTFGDEIVFRNGEYAPETMSGKRLLAHELTHVAQQRGVMEQQSEAGIVQRQADGEAKAKVSEAAESEKIPEVKPEPIDSNIDKAKNHVDKIKKSQHRAVSRLEKTLQKEQSPTVGEAALKGAVVGILTTSSILALGALSPVAAIGSAAGSGLASGLSQVASDMEQSIGSEVETAVDKNFQMGAERTALENFIVAQRDSLSSVKAGIEDVLDNKRNDLKQMENGREISKRIYESFESRGATEVRQRHYLTAITEWNNLVSGGDPEFEPKKRRGGAGEKHSGQIAGSPKPFHATDAKLNVWVTESQPVEGPPDTISDASWSALNETARKRLTGSDGYGETYLHEFDPAPNLRIHLTFTEGYNERVAFDYYPEQHRVRIPRTAAYTIGQKYGTTDSGEPVATGTGIARQLGSIVINYRLNELPLA